MLLVLATMACALVPATAGAATLHATPSTFGQTWTAAGGGDTILLGSGTYGDWSPSTKGSMVTLSPESGAVVSMAGPGFVGSSYITVRGVRFTSGIVLRDNAHHIVLDGDTFDGLGIATWEGRVSLNLGAHDNTISNSHFGGGGCSDGVFFGNTSNNTIGPGNTFEDLLQGSCGAHVDAIQFYGGADNNTITGNLFVNDTTGIAEYDGGSNGTVVTNNAVRNIAATSMCITLSGSQNARIEHNTTDAACTINFGSKPGQQVRNITSRNNVAGAFVVTNTGSAPTYAANDYNLGVGSQPAGAHSLRCTPTFPGGNAFTSVAGAALTSSSCGYLAGSDGTSMGTASGGGQPPADTTAPTTTIASGPSNPTSSTSASFGFTSNESGTFQCQLDAGAYASCSSPKAYSALSTGSHTFNVRATDAAGNVDASAATQTWTITTAADTTAPETTITSGPANPTTATTSSSGFTSNETGSTFTCKLDAGAYASCSSPTANSGLSMGSHTFSVRATDMAGNMDATPASQTWMIQSAPPADSQPVAAYVYSPTAPATGQAVSFDASGATCADVPCTYSWADDGTDGAGGTQWPLGSGKTMSFTFQGTGVKNVRLVVTDADGDSNSIMKSITVASSPPADTTAPNTTIDSGPSATTTNDNTPTFGFSSSEGASTFQCQVDSGSWAGCASPWTTSTLSNGAHSVAVRATDAAGNTDATPATRSFTVSTATTPQNLLGSSVVQSAADGASSGSGEAFQATAAGSGAVVSLSIYVDATNTATTLVAGLYRDVNGHPRTLMNKGTRSSLTAGAWNSVSIPATSLNSGQKYWIAVMGTGGGGLRYRDGAGGSNCHSESSSSSSMTTLPTTWSSGASWPSCPLSGYATS